MIRTAEMQINAVEFAKVERQVFDALKTGADALKSLQRDLNLSDIDRLNADTDEALAYQQQVNDALSEDLDASSTADAERELEEMEAAAMQKTLDEGPKVPVHKLRHPESHAEPPHHADRHHAEDTTREAEMHNEIMVRKARERVAMADL